MAASESEEGGYNKVVDMAVKAVVSENMKDVDGNFQNIL